MAVQLTNQDIQDLKKQGFNDAEINKAISEVERDELQGSYQNTQNQRTSDPRQFSKQSSFGARASDDLVRWQLELNDILERAEHILKGDVVVFENGHLIWKDNPKPELNTLNEFGVQLIMKYISDYINRNTILSDYDKTEIGFKVFDFGRELNNLFFMKYEELGMNTEDKRKEYPMLIRAMVDLVHSAYNRAKDGGERRSLREMISIQQSHQSVAQGGVTVNPTGQINKTRGILNPMRWIGGKYA